MMKENLIGGWRSVVPIRGLVQRVWRYGFLLILTSCLPAQQPEKDEVEIRPDLPAFVDLDQLAQVFSALPLGTDQMREVQDAVSSSSDNGYDEEYLLQDLLSVPGKGVGEKKSATMVTRSARLYKRPIRDLLEEYLRNRSTVATSSVKNGHRGLKDPLEGMSAEEYLSLLSRSQTQLYWPYSERWDGHTLPIITFDPENGSDFNTGYLLVEAEGHQSIREVEVTESLARTHPVWVLNRNDDSGFTTIEMHRQSDPSWGMGGGGITIGPASISHLASPNLKTLVIKDFTALRHYDSWFSGASEYLIKCGSIEDFTASTEAELKLFNPSITDFMIVVRRNEIGMKKPINTVLVSDMSPQLVNSAFMMIEDDGGRKTEWKCEAIVRIKSKSYGFTLSLPYSSEDDIVWRGALSTKYFWDRNKVTERFGDVELTFEIRENAVQGT